MTPAESAAAALRAHLRVRGIAPSGAEAEDAVRIVRDAWAAAGLVVVSAEDLRVYLCRGKDLKAEVAAMNRLRTALPERVPDA